MGQNKLTLKYKLLSSLLLGLGFISLLSPIFFYWFIHGSYERYLWIINGPWPFSDFGGGPFQLIYLIILPIIFGLILITASIIMKNKINGLDTFLK